MLFNITALIGTSTLCNPNDPTDVKYAYIVFILTSILTLTVTLLRAAQPRSSIPPSTHKVSSTRITNAVVLLYLLALFVTAAYYAAVGHITFIESIASDQYDAASGRLSSYAGEQSFLPGYANQFKNAILPILSIAIIHRLWVRKAPFRAALSVLIGGIAFVFLAGTGQRAPTMIMMIIILIAARMSGKLSAKRTGILAIAGFAAFAILTSALQRQAGALAGASDNIDRIVIFGQGLTSRIFLENPISGIAAFHLTEQLPTAWGRDWISEISGVLPGVRGSDLANRVFETMYGSRRGTAPPTLWGSLYYNFQLPLAIVVTVVIAVTFFTFTKRYYFSRRTNGNFLQCLALAGMAVSSGAWIAGSPLTILNQGFVAYVFVYWFASREYQKEQANSDDNIGHSTPAHSGAAR